MVRWGTVHTTPDATTTLSPYSATLVVMGETTAQH